MTGFDILPSHVTENEYPPTEVSFPGKTALKCGKREQHPVEVESLRALEYPLMSSALQEFGVCHAHKFWSEHGFRVNNGEPTRTGMRFENVPIGKIG